ncbi:tail fiber protein S' [Aeromonas phage avDM12-TAAL]|nr:tail fiber protein S' [Aeromonas phage avDM12-TAAL]
MADLKLGSQIGGNLIWHQGILELNPVDDKLFYRDQEIMTTKGYQTMLGSIKFGTPNDVYDIESMSDGPGGVKRYLRKMRSGAASTIWHETINDRLYTISTGVTDSAPQFILNNGDSATFQYPVLTNSPQSGAANSFTRRDYVVAEDAKKVNKTGDGMTGNLDFHNDNQGIRVKFPGGSVANNTGVFGGTGDAAAKDKTNIQIKSWYGVGFSPTVTTATSKVVADGENSIWFDLRNGKMTTVGRLFVDTDKEVYSPVNKPTPGDLNAYTKAEVDAKHWIRVKDERAAMIQPSALDARTISAYFTNKSDVSTNWVSGFTVKGWDTTYASWSIFSSSRSDTDDKRLWFKHGRTDWAPSSRIYHENDKPTNVELNLVSRDGDEMTGLLNMKVPDSMGYGKYSIQLNNGSIGGINQLVFNDPSDTTSEGIAWPKTGKNSSSATQADYDMLWAFDGKLLFNNKETYGEWNKPTADDTQSMPDIRTKLSVDLDTVTGIGFYYQDTNANATAALHYPVGVAGSLVVSRSAYGIQQEYTTFTGLKYIRGRGTSTWSEWKEIYGEASSVQFVNKKGDTISGTLKSTANIVIESTYDSMLTLNSTDDGPNYITFARNGDNRFFIRQSTTGDIATDRLELLSGVKNAGGAYLTPFWVSSTGVYTNLPQSDSANALTRKDYVDTKVGTAVQSVTATGAVKSTGGINPVISLTNATNSADGAMSAADKAKLDGLPAAAVNKTGDSMTGNLTFSNDSILQWSRNTDYARIGFKNDSNGDVDSYMHFTVGDDDNEYFKFRTQASGKAAVDLINIKKANTTFMHDVVLAARESNELTLTNDAAEYTGNTGVTRIIGGVFSQWYKDNMIFGHVRGSSTGSAGFGVKLNDKYLMQLSPDRSLVTGAVIGDSYLAVQKNDRILAMEVDATNKIPYISVDGTYQAIRFENDRAITMPAGDLSVAKTINAGGNVVAYNNVSVTGQEIVFADKATGKTSGETGITTARMIEMLTTMGAFKTVYWCGKATWDYAGNNVLTDTGYGNIHLAGCIVEVIGKAQYMIRITTPTTTGSSLTPNSQNNASGQFIYVNHGSAYSPGWRRQMNAHEVNYGQAGTKDGILNKIPFVGPNGVMEIGQYIDFHHTQIADEDFHVRLQVGGSKQLQIVSTNGSIDIGAQNTSYAHIYTDRPSFYLNKGLTALGALNITGNMNINNGAPTIVLQDTDHMGAFLHCNSNLFYVLRSPSANNGTFDSGPNGIHPMTLNLENGDVQFSRNGSFNDVQIRSDIRLKSNFQPILNAVDKVCTLSGQTFDKFGCDKREAGIIAQHLQKVLPEAVGSFKNTAGEEFLTVSNSGVNALLVEAIKELKAEIEELKSKLK